VYCDALCACAQAAAAVGIIDDSYEPHADVEPAAVYTPHGARITRLADLLHDDALIVAPLRTSFPYAAVRALSDSTVSNDNDDVSDDDDDDDDGDDGVAERQLATQVKSAGNDVWSAAMSALTDEQRARERRLRDYEPMCLVLSVAFPALPISESCESVYAFSHTHKHTHTRARALCEQMRYSTLL
jgi:hypothetical protein